MVKRILSALAVLALLANPLAIWAQAGACIQFCLQSCDHKMIAMHRTSPGNSDGDNHATHAAVMPAPTTNSTHHTHCGGTHQIAASAPASAQLATSAPSHKQSPVAPCCQASHKAHVMEAGVSPALLIGLLPVTVTLARFEIAQKFLQQASPLHNSTPPSPPFEPPRS